MTDYERRTRDFVISDVVITRVSRFYGVTPNQILREYRTKLPTVARFVAAYLMRKQGMTTIAIGRALQRDHSTVIHGIKRVEASPALLEDATGIEGRRPGRAIEILPFGGEGSEEAA